MTFSDDGVRSYVTRCTQCGMLNGAIVYDDKMPPRDVARFLSEAVRRGLTPELSTVGAFRAGPFCVCPRPRRRPRRRP